MLDNKGMRSSRPSHVFVFANAQHKVCGRSLAGDGVRERQPWSETLFCCPMIRDASSSASKSVMSLPATLCSGSGTRNGFVVARAGTVNVAAADDDAAAVVATTAAVAAASASKRMGGLLPILRGGQGRGIGRGLVSFSCGLRGESERTFDMCLCAFRALRCSRVA